MITVQGKTIHMQTKNTSYVMYRNNGGCAMKRIVSQILLSVLLMGLLSGCGGTPEGYETVWVVSAAKSSEWRWEYTYNEAGLLLSEAQEKKGEEPQIARWTYDEENREILYEEPAKDFRRTKDWEKGVWVVWEKGKTRSGNLDTGKPAADTAEYTYDDQGRVLKKVTRSLEKTYAYDAAGNVIYESTVTTLGRRMETYYTYDQTGNLLERRKTDSLAKGEEVLRCTYDDRGNCLTYCLTMGEWLYLTEYTYDEEGRELSKREYHERKENDPQVLKREWLSTYDKEGRLQELTVWENISKVAHVNEVEVTILYTYDRHGNLKTLCRKGERPVRFTYRAMQVPTALADTIRTQQKALQDRVKVECNMRAATYK